MFRFDQNIRKFILTRKSLIDFDWPPTSTRADWLSPRESQKYSKSPETFLERNKITGQMGLEKMIADFSVIAAKSERVVVSRVRRKNQSREKTHETPSRSTFTIDLLSPNLKYH